MPTNINSTDFGADSSSRFLLRVQTDSHNVTDATDKN